MGEAQRAAPDISLKGRHEYALAQVREIVGRIWKFVLIGVAVGALIHGYVPEDFVARIAGDGGFLSVVGAVLVGVPLYSDAVASFRSPRCCSARACRSARCWPS